MSKSIPDRWQEYKASGDIIEGTRIICFKVPLRKSVQESLSSVSEIWDINCLLSRIPTLCAVIDLTNTDRYYDPRELKRAGILYRKIKMEGRIMPSKEAVAEFKNTVEAFLKRKPNSLVGVHCTHGLNRTGYMVCRYMIDRLGMHPQDAIQKFETARGHPMERKNYISALKSSKPARSREKGKSSDQSMMYRSPLTDEYDEDERYASRGRYERTTRSDPCSTHSYNFKYDY